MESTFNLDLSENVAYDIPAFPAYIRKGILSSYPNYAANSHWHEDLEFIVILKGTMSYNINGATEELTSGNGILVNSRQLHYGFSLTQKECEFICILLHPSLLSGNTYFYKNYIETFTFRTDIPYIHMKREELWHAQMIDIISEIFKNRKNPDNAFIVMEGFTRIFRLLNKNLPPKDENINVSSDTLNSLKKILLYVQDNYQESISLAMLANAGLCSKSKCNTLFHHYLHKSPMLYLCHFRLAKSAELLLNTNMTVLEISMECGFNSESYYCESFKNLYHITPAEYRKRNKSVSPTK